VGTWGDGIYGNDVALDFVETVRARGGKREVVVKLVERAAVSASALVGDDVVAAAEMITAAAEGTASASGLALTWKPSERDRKTAASALEAVARESESAYNRHDAGHYAEWVRGLDVLHRRLGGDGIARTAPEERKPAAEIKLSDLRAAAARLGAGHFDPIFLPCKDWRELLADVTAPRDPTAVGDAAAPVIPGDVWGWAEAALGYGDLGLLAHVLAFPETTEKDFYITDLSRALGQLYITAAYAGVPCAIGERRAEALAATAFAEHALVLASLLGGDRDRGLLSLISDRTSGSLGDFKTPFERAMGFVLACSLWATALLEASKTAPQRVAAAAPVLVCARLVLRLRRHWSDQLDLADASRRIAAWTRVDETALASVHRRVSAVAGWLDEVEQGAAVRSTRKLEPGSPVLTPKSGVSLVLAVAGPQVVVAGLGFPRSIARRFPAASLTPLDPPAGLGMLHRGLPTAAALDAEQGLVQRGTLVRVASGELVVVPSR
jgi:hypothetical protein